MEIITNKAVVPDVEIFCLTTGTATDSSALARKRRREKLGGILSSTPSEVSSSRVAKVESDYSSDDSSRQAKGPKRPQMKYDPDVPMTKQEASAWRREQRRKRNRESAAACRKRQRDRIAELEIEVSEWKAKFDEALAELNKMEEDDGSHIKIDISDDVAFDRCGTPDTRNASGDLLTPFECVSHRAPESHQANYVSPCSGANFFPSEITSSPTCSIPSLENTVKMPFVLGKLPVDTRVETGQHLKEKITRPAKSRLLQTRQRQLNPCIACFLTQ